MSYPNEDERNGPGSADNRETTAAGSAVAPDTVAPDAGNADVPDAQEGPDLAAENAELKDRLLRALAETENVRRRAERDRLEAAQYGIANFARDMLTVADNLRRALDHIGADTRAAADEAMRGFVEGVEVTERELFNILERHKIRVVNPKGERFDPNFHQAMFEVEQPDAVPGTVVEVIQPGYVVGERLLRPAMVGVAKAPAARASERVDTSA